MNSRHFKRNIIVKKFTQAYKCQQKGNENVIVGENYNGAYAFDLIQDEVESIEWMDNGEPLKFVQGDGMLAVKFTGYEYGTSYVVRVAKAEIKNK